MPFLHPRRKNTKLIRQYCKVVKTEGLKCIEMREGRRWREHIDYFGIAAIAYCMLYGSYIDVVKVQLKSQLSTE